MSTLSIRVIATDPGGLSVSDDFTLTTLTTTVGPIEAVDLTNYPTQVGILVGTSARQTWLGYGWGAHDSTTTEWNRVFGGTPAYTKLCEDMGATVVRLLTPEQPTNFNNNYLAIWNLIKNHGIDIIFTSPFVYTTANTSVPPSTSPDIAAIAIGIDAAITAGFNPTRKWATTIQNEHDGESNNHIPTGGLTAARQHKITLRTELNNRGRTAVEVLGLEHRHPEQWLVNEYNTDNAAPSLFPNTVTDLVFHSYDDGSVPANYDNLFLSARPSMGFWHTETGNNGNSARLNDSSTQARMIAAMNHGSKVEITHQAISGIDAGDNNNIQGLINPSDGKPWNWYYGTKIISLAIPPGTVFRLCTSNDNPTSPATLPTTERTRMLWTNANAPRNARQFVAAGFLGGKLRLVAHNWAYGTDSAQPTFGGGHYPDPGGSGQQLTVTVPEMIGTPRVLDVRRASATGVESSGTLNMDANGTFRFKIAPQETVTVVEPGTSIAFAGVPVDYGGVPVDY